MCKSKVQNSLTLGPACKLDLHISTVLQFYVFTLYLRNAI